MTHDLLPQELAFKGLDGKTIILVVLDGLGGLPHPDTGETELESASIPNLNTLAAHSSLGMICPVAQGVTPGSGPGHLSLFGYDPTTSIVGRGILSALGVGFELCPGDVAARLNLATVDDKGVVIDRRAGRPSDQEGRRLVDKIVGQICPPNGVETMFIHEKEHRIALVLRGEGLDAGILDTDPHKIGLKPLPVIATDPASTSTVNIVQDLLGQIGDILADEPSANSVLARGFAKFSSYWSFEERYGLRAVALAKYPMYRGIARLVGMTAEGVPNSNDETVGLLEECYGGYDFYFVHFKDPDSMGHDGDFDGKVKAIEAVDAILPRITALNPDVMIVTGDHSTPAIYREHSWHHVPVLIASQWTRSSADKFSETSCRGGDLGVFYGKDLMSLALAHAARLDKYGA